MEYQIVDEPLSKSGQTLHIIKPERSHDRDLSALQTYLNENREAIEEMILTSGAVLFRGFDIRDKEEFLQVKNLFAGDSAFNYVDGNSPRKKLAADVYTSTEYPQEYRITLHNELSYSRKWPQRIYFFCKTPAAEGGETPIADCRLILKMLDPKVVQQFEDHGVKYTRYLSPAIGVGKSWMDTFETTDKKQVEEYCIANEMEFSWDGDNLYLSQVGPGVIRHPVTGEKVWFNQANQFHPSNLPEDIYRMLKMLHAKDKRKFPQYALYGNGEEIPESCLKEITEAHFDSAVIFPWRQGDLLMLDNLFMAHGRLPFKGDRKIFVSMS